MIRVEITVAVLEQKYEFRLDENAKISSLVEEIDSIISTKTGMKWADSSRQLLLADKYLNTILPGNLSLKDCGVKNGHELLLI